MAAVAAAVLTALPFTASPAPGGAQTGHGARLAKVSERRNAITDTERWFSTNQLRWPAVEVRRLRPGERTGVPSAIPIEHAGAELWRIIHEPPLALLIYGGRYVAGYDPATERYRFAYDFAAYITPPASIPADREFVDETVEWASVEGGVLYVSNFHRTYARSSRGSNAYVTAIDLAGHKLLWRSPPLVSNTNTFMRIDDAIVTGYGFTAEPDFVYVVDKRTGTTRQRIAVRSGPEYVLRRGDRVFVRTYDTDYVLRIVP
jgi:hypothetical protein